MMSSLWVSGGTGQAMDEEQEVLNLLDLPDACLEIILLQLCDACDLLRIQVRVFCCCFRARNNLIIRVPRD